ncbi:MAG: hypothetical protein IT392_10895 [Nitrospirae bacterium]|nr:hypothetical protein [Nitrospirota bacterium]
MLMISHHDLSPRFAHLHLLIVFLLITILSGCSSEYSPIGPQLEGSKSISGGNMLLLAGESGGTGTSDGIGKLARFNAPNGIAPYNNDTLYVADKTNHTIRKIDLYTGTVTTIAGYPRVAGRTDGVGVYARFNSPEGVATDGTYLYVADTGNHVIRKIEIQSGTVATLAGLSGQAGYSDGDRNNTLFKAPSGITILGNSLYVTDSDNHLIRKVDKDSGYTTTAAGTAFTAGTADGVGLSAQFNYPLKITNDGNYLYIADTFNHTIRIMNPQNGYVLTLSGSAGKAGFADGSLSRARFSYPAGLVIRGEELYVADLGNDIVRVIDLNQATVGTIAGTPQVTGYSDGVPGVGMLNSPADVAVIGDYLYIADMSNNAIRVVNISSGETTTLAGFPSHAGNVNEKGSNSRFNAPGGIAIDGDELFVADTYSHVIRKIVASTGEVTTLAGTSGHPGSTDSSESDAVFNSPTDVIAGANGQFIYIVDTDNHVIRSMNLSTGEVRTFAGTPGSTGKADGIGTAARFKSPKRGVRIGNRLYIADTGNNTIRAIDISTAAVTTLAGTPGVAGSKDTAESINGIGQFNAPGDIATDGTNLYVADTGNHTIRRINPASGVVTTISGSRETSGLVDSNDGAPKFNSPEGITWYSGFLYVSDTANHLIRKIDLNTMEVSLLAGDEACVVETTVTNGFESSVKKCTGQQAGSSSYGDSTDGTGKTTSFNAPTGINTDGSYLYVMDTGTNRIRRVNMNTGETKTFSYSKNKGVTLVSPTGGDISGNFLYVADKGNQVIRKLDISSLSAAPLILIAGNVGANGYGYSAGYSSRFNSPIGITADGMGNLYVADTGNHTIRKVVISTGEVTTVTGVPGTAGFMNSEFGYPLFNAPRGICFVGDHLYVSDSGNHLIRRVNLSTGYVGLVAGLTDFVKSVGSPGTADSTGAAAGFNDPGGIASDGVYLYVSDSGNNTIRRVLISTGQVKTIAGMPGVIGFRDGVSFNANFYYPRGIAVDGDYLYVADTGNNVLRRVNKLTGEVLTFSGKVGQSSFVPGTSDIVRYNAVIGVATSQDTPYLFFTDGAENVVGKIEK